jgi:hypothetical protein
MHAAINAVAHPKIAKNIPKSELIAFGCEGVFAVLGVPSPISKLNLLKV